MIEKNAASEHIHAQKLTLDSRRTLSLNGVSDVLEFSDKEVVLLTNMGKLIVKGENLKISNLNVDTGDFCVNGLIISLIYQKASTSAKSTSIFEKLFR